MTKIKYDINLMKFMTIFENLTQTKVKDLVEEGEQLIFILSDPSDMGRAIGRQGSNIKALEKHLKRKIKIVAFDPDLKGFVKNLIYPLGAKEIIEEDGVLIVVGQDTRTKGLLIGRDKKNLGSLKAIIQRYFPIKDFRVI